MYSEMVEQVLVAHIHVLKVTLFEEVSAYQVRFMQEGKP